MPKNTRSNAGMEKRNSSGKTPDELKAIIKNDLERERAERMFPAQCDWVTVVDPPSSSPTKKNPGGRYYRNERTHATQKTQGRPVAVARVDPATHECAGSIYVPFWRICSKSRTECKNNSRAILSP